MQGLLRKYSEDKIVILTDYQDGIERFELRNDGYEITKHSTLMEYKSFIDKETFGSLYKFATVRNPWDMMVSYYFQPGMGNQEWNREKFCRMVRKMPTLRHYVGSYSLAERIGRKIGLPTRPKASALTREIDFLVRFEHINEDFRRVCEHIKIPFSPLPERNKSSHAHYSHYYDKELVELVRRKFPEEISYGNYEFESS